MEITGNPTSEALQKQYPYGKTRRRFGLNAFSAGWKAAHERKGSRSNPYPDHRNTNGRVTFSRAYRRYWIDGYEAYVRQRIKQWNGHFPPGTFVKVTSADGPDVAITRGPARLADYNIDGRIYLDCGWWSFGFVEVAEATAQEKPYCEWCFDEGCLMCSDDEWYKLEAATETAGGRLTFDGHDMRLNLQKGVDPGF
jgi:hypothetical protein